MLFKQNTIEKKQMEKQNYINESMQDMGFQLDKSMVGRNCSKKPWNDFYGAAFCMYTHESNRTSQI